MTNLNVKFKNLNFKNPVIMASGTFGFGKEYGEIYDIEKLGGISSKGLTLNKKDGNTGIRVWETPSGMMNSVGLENPGVQGFIDKELSYFSDLDLVRIVNLGGGTLDDYIKGAELLRGQDVLVIKLSPNAEDIVGMARVCEEEGADGVSLVNTFKALAIDINKRKPVFENIYAGLSGPAIKPIALRMVNEVSKNIEIPVWGMGGITNATDAIEFIMAGSSCIQVGTANFINPRIGLEIIDGIEKFMKKEKIKTLDEIRGII